MSYIDLLIVLLLSLFSSNMALGAKYENDISDSNSFFSGNLCGSSKTQWFDKFKSTIFYDENTRNITKLFLKFEIKKSSCPNIPKDMRFVFKSKEVSRKYNENGKLYTIVYGDLTINGVRSVLVDKETAVFLVINNEEKDKVGKTNYLNIQGEFEINLQDWGILRELDREKTDLGIEINFKAKEKHWFDWLFEFSPTALQRSC